MKAVKGHRARREKGRSAWNGRERRAHPSRAGLVILLLNLGVTWRDLHLQQRVFVESVRADGIIPSSVRQETSMSLAGIVIAARQVITNHPYLAIPSETFATCSSGCCSCS